MGEQHSWHQLLSSTLELLAVAWAGGASLPARRLSLPTSQLGCCSRPPGWR